MIEKYTEYKTSLFCFLSQKVVGSMYEKIDMLFHHGYRTRVLMNLIEPNSHVWRGRNAKWRDTLEGNRLSKNNGGDMTEQNQTEIRQNGNMYDEPGKSRSFAYPVTS